MNGEIIMTYFIVNMAVSYIAMVLHKYIFPTAGFFESVLAGVAGVLLFKLLFGGNY